MAKYLKKIQGARKWLAERDGERCAKCGVTENLTVDHIVPLAIMSYFGVMTRGSHAFKRPDWLQLLCQDCNHKKGSKVDWSNQRTKSILLELMDMSEKGVDLRDM